MHSFLNSELKKELSLFTTLGIYIKLSKTKQKIIKCNIQHATWFEVLTCISCINMLVCECTTNMFEHAFQHNKTMFDWYSLLAEGVYHLCHSPFKDSRTILLNVDQKCSYYYADLVLYESDFFITNLSQELLGDVVAGENIYYLLTCCNN